MCSLEYWHNAYGVAHEGIRSDRCVHWNIGTIPTALRRYNIQNCEYIHWNIDMTPMTLRRYNIQNCEYIHYNIGIKYTALRGARIHHVGYIHWNTGITPTAFPVGKTLNMRCLHLKNMNIFIDVFTFISQFFISTHIHFRPFTYKTQLAK